MSVTLYGVPISQPVRAILFACAYKGLAVDLKPRMPGQKGAKGTQSAEFGAINPWGATVPAISEGEGAAMWTLSESPAILAYLASKHGWDDLYPPEPRARAAVDRYLHWHHRGSREVTLALFAPAVRKDLQISPGAVAALRKNVAGIFATIEKNLAAAAAAAAAAGGSGPTFLCGGSQPTLADFCCFAELGQCKPEFGNLWDFSGLPATSALMAAMEALPGFEASHKPLKKFAPVLQKMVAKFNAKLEAKL